MTGIVAFAGFAGAGKSTAAGILADLGYLPISFADAIKDCLAAIFGWPRHLLEGGTEESRQFRETVDPWWAERLGIPGFTPRFAMRFFGTDVMRRHGHDDLWVLNVEHRLAGLGDRPVVFGDVRHPNEFALARRLGGRLVRVRKGEDPAWFGLAARANNGDADAERQMRALGIHSSERAWIGLPLDATVFNDASIDDLRSKLLMLISK